MNKELNKYNINNNKYKEGIYKINNIENININWKYKDKLKIKNNNNK